MKGFILSLFVILSINVQAAPAPLKIEIAEIADITHKELGFVETAEIANLLPVLVKDGSLLITNDGPIEDVLLKDGSLLQWDDIALRAVGDSGAGGGH